MTFYKNFKVNYLEYKQLGFILRKDFSYLINTKRIVSTLYLKLFNMRQENVGVTVRSNFYTFYNI